MDGNLISKRAFIPLSFDFCLDWRYEIKLFLGIYYTLIKIGSHDRQVQLGEQ